MIALPLVLALLAVQEPLDGPGSAEAKRLRREIEARERRLEELRARHRDAVGRGDAEAAKELNRELARAEQDLDGLRQRLREVENPPPPMERASFELKGLATHWDNDLDLEDGVGWGATVYLRDFLFAQVRRWDPEDERGDEDGGVTAYTAGFSYEFGLAEERTSSFVFVAGAGIARFTSDAPGSDDDNGPILTASPHWMFAVTPRIRVNAGAEIDIARTDFNQRRTHTVHTFSLLASIEIAF
jgi:hypothetical protein